MKWDHKSSENCHKELTWWCCYNTRGRTNVLQLTELSFWTASNISYRELIYDEIAMIGEEQLICYSWSYVYVWVLSPTTDGEVSLGIKWAVPKAKTEISMSKVGSKTQTSPPFFESFWQHLKLGSSGITSLEQTGSGTCEWWCSYVWLSSLSNNRRSFF